MVDGNAHRPRKCTVKMIRCVRVLVHFPVALLCIIHAIFVNVLSGLSK